MVTREEIESLDFEKLAEAIIVHSARQYCTAFKKLLRNPHCRSAINAKKENEEFFRSKWFKTLANANIDSDAMIARLIDKAKSDAKYERTKRSRPEQRQWKEVALLKRKERIARAKARAKAKAETKKKVEKV